MDHRSTEQPLVARDQGAASAAHSVQFFYAGRPGRARVATFLAEGLLAGEAGLVIARAPHGDDIVAALASSGIDVAEARRVGRLIVLDAEEVLDTLRGASTPDADRFEAVIGAQVRRLETSFGRVRAYCEMVDVLMLRGRKDAAIALESLWHELMARTRLALRCGYSLRGFDDPLDVSAFQSVCAIHDEVHAAIDPASTRETDVGRLVAEAELRARASAVVEIRRELASERDRLCDAEQQARADAEAVTRHLVLVQQVTSALCEAATPDDVAHVAVTIMASTVGADQALLVIPSDGGERLTLLRHSGLSPAMVKDLAEFSSETPLPAAMAFRTGEPVWLATPEAIAAQYPHLCTEGTKAIVCIPVTLSGRRLGVLGFGFFSPRRFGAPERALASDLARQAALALDRANLLADAQRSRERAEEASRAKDDFLAMLGHELRNPLAPIVTAIELLKLRGADAGVRRELHVIERQVRTMIDLVDDLLDVSRITRGKVQLSKQVVEASPVITRAVEVASPLLEQRRHYLEVRVPSSGLKIDVDEGRMAQVIANLLINAAKYTEPGGRIVIEAERDAAEVVVRVRDNGVGIAPDLLPRIFDAFVQGERTRHRGPGGLGIGLAIAKSLLELHDGGLSARSDGPGRGSEFAVRLPAAHGPALRSPSRNGAGASLPDTAGRGRILVVDDNRDAADVLAEALRSLGFAVKVAYDGPSALLAATSFRPAVALLDIGLPAMDGYEVATKLRGQTDLAPLRLVAVTGYGQEVDRAQAREAGFDAHLVKPIALAAVASVLDTPPVPVSPARWAEAPAAPPGDS